MMRATSSATPLPQPIADYINRFVARRRMQRLLRAAVRAMLLSIIWALAWCAIDRFVTLDPNSRMIALGLIIAIVALILIRPLLAMLRRRRSSAASRDGPNACARSHRASATSTITAPRASCSTPWPRKSPRKRATVMPRRCFPGGRWCGRRLPVRSG